MGKAYTQLSLVERALLQTQWALRWSPAAIQAAEKLTVLKGNDFSRAVSRVESMRALAPEGCISSRFREISLFPQPV
jgi:hypothetical protein